MSVSKPESRLNSGDQADILVNVDRLISGLPKSAVVTAAVQEGSDVDAIVKSLGLPDELRAAVRLCPLVRDGHIEDILLDNKEFLNVSRLIQGLLQLARFELPQDWAPGEALAVQQSEALRKMLLAVVSDVRLVLVRIAEQLYRLRQAKKAPRRLQQSLAIETREIYAALASRLGVWQLKWELEDLSFRYLDPDSYASIAAAQKPRPRGGVFF